MAIEQTLDNWTSSWPDAVAFAAGLAVARWAGWNTGDLVWTMWLSSLVVGYATIVWMICQPAGELLRVSWRDRALVSRTPRTLVGLALVILAGVSFFLAFFTVHFGGFHYVHSQILVSFFPIDTGAGPSRALDANMATYVEVARRYWPFLPSAFLAHRAAFLRKPLSLDRNTLADSKKLGNLFSEPYRNVIRMHVLLFFFVFAHFARLENFAVYTVVYAAYFFPWRLVRRPAPGPAPVLP